MATIVGDKLKLSNYSYLLSRDGTSFINAFQVTGNRTRQEKIIDAVDIDWRPFRFKNFAYVSTPGKATYTYVTNAGDLFDTERLIDWISYSYSMGYNLDFYGYIYHNKLLSNVKRPNILTNIGWIDKDSRIIGYTFWPAVGAQYRLTNNQDDWENIYYDSIGEIFNDYTRNAATGSYSHAEGGTTISSGNYSHAEGKSTIASGQSSHAEGESTQSQGKYSHAEGGSTLAYGDYAHAEGSATMAIGNYSHVEGIGNITTVSSIKADGTKENVFTFPTEQPLIASEVGSHAEGIATQALQGGAHAEGVHTYSYGLGSHSEGALTYAKARYAHAEGLNAYVFGEASHAEGAYNRIYGDFSHIEGYGNITYSTYSHIGGSNNLAYGKWNHVEGNLNKINSTNAHHNLVSGDNNTISNNSSYNIIHSKNVSITNTAQSLIIGSENTLNQSFNILGIGEQNNITSSDFISSLGTGNTATNSNNILISGQENTISNANYGTILGFKNVVSGDDMFVSGVNNTNNKIHSVLIGNNLKNTQNTTDLGITILGHYNTERAAYNFIIGDGTTNTNRHNALEITNNGWTYISALATYVNNIVAYTAHKPIAYNTDFVSVYSFAGIERHAYTIPYYSNSYNLLTYSYILPTKQYVDKLLELKDAFRFAGTFTPTNTNISFAEEGTTHTVSGTWIPTTWFNNGETDTKTTTYDSSTAAVWRVTKRGWFGSYVVEGGDLLIAYADATRTSDENWAIIETHMNWVDNTAAYLINGTNGHRILSNFHLTDSGILTYTYTQLHHAYVSNQHNGFLTNLAIVNNGNNIQVSYVHTYFQNQNTNTASTKSLHNVTDYTYSPENNDQNGTKTHSDFKNANDVDSITVVNNINMNGDGKLTYAYLTVNKLRMHHNNIGYFTTTYNIDAGILNINGDYIDVIANVHLTDDGTLSYTRSHYTNIKTHHHTYNEYNNNGTNYRTGIKEVNTDIDSVLPANDQYKVISYAYINSTGTVYTYYYELQNVRHHHHTYTPHHNDGTNYRTNNYEVDTNVDTVLPANDQYRILSYAYINSGGVAYTYYYNLSNLRHHHHNEYTSNSYNVHNNLTTITDNSFGFIGEVNLSSDGKLTYIISSVTNLRTHHDNINMTYTVVNKNADNSYTTTYNLSGAYISGTYNYDNELGFISNVALDSKGTFTYTTSYVKNLREHHESYNDNGNGTYYPLMTSGTNTNSYNATSYDEFTGIKNVYLDKKGRLTYNYFTVQEIRTHHRTTTPTSTTYRTTHKPYYLWDELGELNNSYENVDEVKIIDNLHLNKFGTITYTVTYINRLRNHHDNQKADSTLVHYITTHKAKVDNNDLYPATTHQESDNITVVDNVHLNTVGTLTYTYTNIQRLRYHHDTTAYEFTTYNIDNITDTAGDKIRVLDNAHLDAGGNLTYTGYVLTYLKHHHHSYEYHNTDTSGRTNTEEKDRNINTIPITAKDNVGDKIRIITYTYITNGGYLYSYYATLSNLANHHSNTVSGPTNYHAYVNKTNFERDLQTLDTNESDSITFVDGVNLTTNGKFTYHHSTIDNLRQHHSFKDISTDKTTTYNIGEYDKTGDNSFGFISNVHLESNGRLTYTTSSINNLKTHHGGSSGSYNFLTKVDLNANGRLTGGGGTFTYKGTDSGKSISNELNVITRLSIDSTGKISYIREQIGSVDFGSYAGFAYGLTYGLKITHGGTTKGPWVGNEDITYSLDNHGGSASTGNSNLTPNFSGSFNIIKSISLSATGQLSGTTETITLPTQSHHGGSASGNFLTSVTLSATGILSGTAGTFSYSDLLAYSNIFSRGLTFNSAGRITYTYDYVWGTI